MNETGLCVSGRHTNFASEHRLAVTRFMPVTALPLVTDDRADRDCGVAQGGAVDWVAAGEMGKDFGDTPRGWGRLRISHPSTEGVTPVEFSDGSPNLLGLGEVGANQSKYIVHKSIQPKEFPAIRSS
jgi:hypothetical protein